MVIGGLGRHVVHLSVQEIAIASRLQLFIEEFAVYSFTFVKLSVAFMLRRFNDSCKAWTWTLNGLITLNVLVAISSTFWDYLQCIPLSALWDFSIIDGVCIAHEKFRIWIYTVSGTSSFNGMQKVQINSVPALFVMTDLLTSILPLVLIKRLHIQFRQKLAIGALMGLGLLCTVAAAIKMVKLVNFTTFSQADLTWNAVDLILWGMIECYLGIIAASLPVMKSMIEGFLKRVGFFSRPDSWDQDVFYYEKS